MGRILIFIYGVVAYLAFAASFLYAAAFVYKVIVTTRNDTPIA